MDSDIVSSSIESQMDWMQILTQLEVKYQNETSNQLHQTPPIPATHNSTPPFPIHSIKSGSSMQEMREMIFCMAAMQPIHVDPESIKPPRRKNVKISKDPQSVAARMRRERISEKIRILQRLVPGGTKMDTASMLDEAVQYMKFLKNQVRSMEKATAGGYSRNTVSFNNGIFKYAHQLLR